jgi:hypothetical protein
MNGMLNLSMHAEQGVVESLPVVGKKVCVRGGGGELEVWGGGRPHLSLSCPWEGIEEQSGHACN